ncbi:MAG: trypsin-like peptidase domain-containing protein [Microbacterium sp.]|uniref:S1C family serine protease n=1 Tax=Microbacterium sp. TaxID=51671 RepID=UPI002617727A|nr:trypsin-like peptidase domain-containing protein [Microbacterium sp.]MCX6501313.1 trypsin-like peptidase domain-containing protein [Microbacterium sp.]
MTDTEGTRPEQNAAASSTPSGEQAAESAAPAATGASQPTASGPEGAAQRPPLPPLPPTTARAPYPAATPTGAYGYGQGFGPAAHPGAFGQTAPTQPLGGAPTPVATKKPSSAGRIVGLLVAAALVGGAAGLGGAYAGEALWGGSDPATATGGSVVTVNDTDSVNQTTAVAAKVVPSVVTISVTGGSGGGTGSGVILSDDGYVLTNTHVVTLDGQVADPTIQVTTSDGRIYDATIVGTDPTYDLAVIKLEDASGLTPITWGDSGDLNVGDATIAVGAPLGLSNTVTEGIVSALNRSIEIASSAAPDSSDSEDDSDDQGGQQDNGGQDSPFFFDFGQGETQQSATETIKIAVVQTDAAINPGNSGGALVNSDGELVGINVAIASAGSSSSTGGNIGVGFAIPSTVAERVAKALIADGEATHGLLGATVQASTTVEDATITGAYISEVTSGGAAAEAGLRSGDIVTEFNGAPITDAIDLTAQVRAVAGGDTVSLTYVRDGKTNTAEVTLGTLQ